MVVNLSGGGIGGVIFLGGVLLVTGIVASVFAERKRKQKICDKSNNPKTSASVISIQSEKESKGLQFLVSNCCPNLCKDDHNEGNHEERAKNDDGNLRELEERKVQMDEEEKPSSTHEDNCEISIAYDKENEKLQLDGGQNLEKCDEFDDENEVIKHDLEVPNSGVILQGYGSSTSLEFMDSMETEIVAKEPLDGEDITEEGALITPLMGTQHHDYGGINTRIEIEETSDTSSAKANLAGDDLIENTSEGNNTFEDGDGSHETSEEVENNSDSIWPMNTLQEIGMPRKAGPDKDIIQNTNIERMVPTKQMNHKEEDNMKMIFEIGNEGRMRFVDRYNLHLNSMKWRILLGTLLALVLHLYFPCSVLAF